MNFCKIIIQQQGEPEQEADISFDDEELAVLRTYLGEYHRLSNSKPLQQQLPCEMTISFNKDTGLSVNGVWPSDDDFAVLLHRLRPFFLQKEPASYLKTTAILGRKISHPVFREYMKEQNKNWSGGTFKTSFPMIINGSRLDPEKVFNDWLNAHEYHRDEDRTGSLQVLKERLFPGFLQTIITTRTLEKLRAVRNTAFLLGLFLGEIKELKFEPYMLVRA